MLMRDIVGSPKFLPTDEEGPLSDNSTYLGVEVETEGSGLSGGTGDALGYWRMISDGSLKSTSPWEFIFAQPLAGKQVTQALTELEKLLDPTTVEYPVNTSVHVHMNIGDLSKEELRHLIYLSVVVESALVRYSGNKVDNCFCIPWGNTSPSLLQEVGWFLDEKGGGCHDLARYTTVNFASAFTLGTIEFRTMTGTHNKQAILDWIEVLLALKRYALQTVHDPRSRLDYMLTHKNLTKFLGDIWEPKVVRRMMHRNLHQDMQRSSLVARLGLLPKSRNELERWVHGDDAPPRPVFSWDAGSLESFMNECAEQGVDVCVD